MTQLSLRKKSQSEKVNDQQQQTWTLAEVLT